MRNALMSLVIIAAVSGCSDQQRVDMSAGSVCIDVVKYHTYFSTYKGAMAVAIDSETLQPIKCYGGAK